MRARSRISGLAVACAALANCASPNGEPTAVETVPAEYARLATTYSSALKAAAALNFNDIKQFGQQVRSHVT